MSKKQSIAWEEEFIMYVFVDWKLIKKVVKILKSSGFKASDHRFRDQESDDHELRVIVKPSNANVAHSIIQNIIQ